MNRNLLIFAMNQTTKLPAVTIHVRKAYNLVKRNNVMAPI